MTDRNRNIIRTIVIILILALVSFIAINTLFSNSGDSAQSKNPSDKTGKSNLENIYSDFEKADPYGVMIINQDINHKPSNKTQKKEKQSSKTNQKNTIIPIDDSVNIIEQQQLVPSTPINDEIITQNNEVQNNHEIDFTDNRNQNAPYKQVQKPKQTQIENAKPTDSNNKTQHSKSTDSDEEARKLAEIASTAGNVLTGEVELSSTIRGLITSSVSSELEKWLSQYGVARVQLNLDKDFSLKNSQLDLLFPLHEEENNLSFIQSSFHRTDNRNQMNLGMGYRWFTTNWMLGGNSFFDYDLSRGVIAPFLMEVRRRILLLY